MSYVIKIARLVGTLPSDQRADSLKSRPLYQMVCFQDREPYESLEEAKAEMTKIKQITGKVYAVFSAPDGKRMTHGTADWYEDSGR